MMPRFFSLILITLSATLMLVGTLAGYLALFPLGLALLGAAFIWLSLSHTQVPSSKEVFPRPSSSEDDLAGPIGISKTRSIPRQKTKANADPRKGPLTSIPLLQRVRTVLQLFMPAIRHEDTGQPPPTMSRSYQTSSSGTQSPKTEVPERDQKSYSLIPPFQERATDVVAAKPSVVLQPSRLDPPIPPR